VAVRLRLSDGISIIVRAELAEFQRAYQEALRSNALLEVENGSGKTRIVNPQQILYFEEEDLPGKMQSFSPTADDASHV
jgi:hypothetical protein